MSRRLFLSFFLLWGVSSCAFLGTRAKIYPGVPAEQLGDIGFALEYWPSSATSQFSRAVDSVFTNEIMQQLTQVSGRDVYFIGHLSLNNLNVRVADSLAKVHPGLDAIALCSIRVYSADSTLQARSNATARIFVLKTAERALLARTRFNTNLGKSYWLHPRVADAIKDATAGALAPFRRYFGT